jgi:pimeloyl-ACP methyl ester carboxylesterase
VKRAHLVLHDFGGPWGLCWAVDRDNPRPLPRSFVDRVMRYADWGHKRAVLKLYRASKNPDATFGALSDRVSLLDRPACVIWGAGDKYLPVAYAAKQKESFPQAEVHELSGLGHWPFVDDPAAVRDILVPFLKRQVTGG